MSTAVIWREVIGGIRLRFIQPCEGLMKIKKIICSGQHDDRHLDRRGPDGSGGEPLPNHGITEINNEVP